MKSLTALVRSLSLMEQFRWMLIWIPAAFAVIPPSNASASETLTLQASVDMALRRNHQMQSAAYLDDAGKARIEQLARRKAGRVNVGAVGSQQTYAAQDRLSAVSYNTARAEAVASKMIIASRDLRHDVRLALSDAAEASLDRHQTENDVTLLAKSLYWRLQTLERLRILTQQRLDRYQKTETIAKAQARYGNGTKVDSDWAGVQSALVEDDLASINADLEITTLQFREIVFGDDRADFTLAGDEPVPVKEAERLLAENGDVSKQIVVQKAAYEVRKRAEDHRFAHKRLLPYFSVVAGYNYINGRTGSVSVDDSGTVALRASYPIRYDIPVYYQNNYQFDFRVSYDLYDGLQARADTAAAASRLKSVQAKLESVQADTGRRMEADRVRLRDALDRSRTLGRVAEIADKNAESAAIRYASGRFTLMQLVEVEKDQFDAQTKYVQSQYDLNVAAETVRLNVEGNQEVQ